MAFKNNFSFKIKLPLKTLDLTLYILTSKEQHVTGVGEKALWIKTLALAAEDLGSVPSTQMLASIQFQGIQCPLLASEGTAYTWYTDMQAKHPYR